MNKIIKILLILREFFAYAKQWNLRMAISVVALPKIFHINKYKHKPILSYLEKHYSDVIEKYKGLESSSDYLSDNCPIWICWFQGEENMPPIVKGCLKSVRKYCGIHEVKIITMDNLKDWISIPDYILNKVSRKEISLTHFSDIVRNTILAEQGGIWLDATIFLTNELNMRNLRFYTIKQNRCADHSYVSEYRWTTFCMAGTKGNVLNSFVRDMLNKYASQQNKFIDYLLQDYIIALGYKHIPAIKKLIDDVPYSNPDLYYIQMNMSRPVNSKQLEDVEKNTSVFKLNYKIRVPEDKHSLYYYLGFGDYGKK